MLCELLKHGHDVTIFNRQKRNPPNQFPPKTKFVKGDRNNLRDIEQLFRDDYDVVIDLSGYVPSQIYSIVERFRDQIGQYIFFSSVTVYKSVPNAPIHEEDPRTLIRGTYGGDKALSENILLESFERYRFPITIFRPQGVFGPFDPCQVGLIFYRLIHHLPILIPKNTNSDTNLLYVYDLVKATTLAIGNSNAFGKIYNLAGDKAVTLNQLITLCAETCTTSPILRFVDGSASVNENGVLKKKRHAGIFVDWPKTNEILDTSRANTEIGIEFTNLEVTLQETYSWLIEKPNRINRFSLRGERRILYGLPVPRIQKKSWEIADKLTDIEDKTKRLIKNIFWINKFIRFLRVGR